CPDLTLALILSENTKASIEYGRKGSSMTDFDMNKLIEQDIAMLQHNFKRVVKVEKMADAETIGADLIAIMDTKGEAGSSMSMDAKLILFSPEQKEIDTIKAASSKGMSMSGPGDVVRGVSADVRHQLAVGLRESKPLRDYAKSRAPKTAVAATDKKSRAIVAVFDIHDASKKLEKDALVQLTNYLGTLLTQSGAYKVIPQDQLRQNLLDEKKGSYKECFDERCRIELGKAMSAEKTLATTLIQVGSKCAVTSNLFDLKTETTDKGASVETGCSPDELLSAMKSIAGQLSK
ncbi:hypothetical protein ACFL2F_05380, partial [Myxococcota bacterium]